MLKAGLQQCEGDSKVREECKFRDWRGILQKGKMFIWRMLWMTTKMQRVLTSVMAPLPPFTPFFLHILFLSANSVLHVTVWELSSSPASPSNPHPHYFPLKNKCTPTVSIWNCWDLAGFCGGGGGGGGVSIFYELAHSRLRQKQLWGSSSLYHWLRDNCFRLACYVPDWSLQNEYEYYPDASSIQIQSDFFSLTDLSPWGVIHNSWSNIKAWHSAWPESGSNYYKHNSTLERQIIHIQHNRQSSWILAAFNIMQFVAVQIQVELIRLHCAQAGSSSHPYKRVQLPAIHNRCWNFMIILMADFPTWENHWQAVTLCDYMAVN